MDVTGTNGIYYRICIQGNHIGKYQLIGDPREELCSCYVAEEGSRKSLSPNIYDTAF